MLNGAEPFEQVSTHFDGRPYMKSGENWSSHFREEGI